MEQKEAEQKVETLVKKLGELMGFPFDTTIGQPTSPLQGDFVCRIAVKESSNLLIGQRGINLDSLQHVVRTIARRDLGIDIPFMLDINGYWDEKTRTLLTEARDAAAKADRDRSVVILRPMTSFERKMIHMELADDPRVKTESTGTGEGRKVIVKPASLLEE